MSSLPGHAPAVAPFLVEIRPLALAEFREHILTLYRPPLRAPNTFIAIRRALNLLAQLGGIATTADLTTTTIARFVAWRAGKESPNTTRGHLRKLSVACSIAAAEGWVRVSPFAIRRGWVRSVTPKVPAIHSRTDIARILGFARDEALHARGRDRFRARRLYVLAAVAAYTGMRRTEVLTLRVEDVDLIGRMIDLKARVGGALKTDAAAQPIPIPDALAVILGPWIEHLAGQARAVAGDGPAADLGWLLPTRSRSRPWVDGSHGNRPIDALKALGRRAGVDGLTFQSLRHSWATHAEYWGLADTVIQRILRHTNLRTQHRYRHAEANNLRALTKGIDFGPAGDGAEGVPR